VQSDNEDQLLKSDGANSPPPGQERTPPPHNDQRQRHRQRISRRKRDEHESARNRRRPVQEHHSPQRQPRSNRRGSNYNDSSGQHSHGQHDHSHEQSCHPEPRRKFICANKLSGNNSNIFRLLQDVATDVEDWDTLRKNAEVTHENAQKSVFPSLHLMGQLLSITNSIMLPCL